MKSRGKFLVVITSVSLAVLLLCGAANAVTISIGLAQSGVSGGAITLEATGAGSASISAISYGTFTANSASALGNPPLPSPGLLDSSSINISSSTAGTLYVYVTSQGNTSPVGLVNLSAGFTENRITAGWTVTEEVFMSSANSLWTGTLVDAATFTAISTNTKSDVVNVGAGPFSITEKYTIVANGAGSADSTINVDATPVPEPAALPLVMSGLGFLGFWGWARKRKTQK